MTKTVTIAATRTNGDPYAHHDVIVTLVAGSAGGVVGSNVIVEQSTVKLNASGTGSITLRTNDVEITSPSTSFYRFTVADSSPTITRSIRLTDDLPSSVSWTLAGIQVGDPTIPQRDVSSDYVTIGGQSLTNYLADRADAAAVDLFLAVATTDGTNTSWDVLAPDAAAEADGLVPAGWSSTVHLDMDGADFIALAAPDADPDTVFTLLVPGGDAVGVWQFTPATIEDPWTRVDVSLAYCTAPKWFGAATDAGAWVTITDDPTATGGGVSLGETSTTAYRGDRGKAAYDHSQVVTGNPHGTTAADVGAQPVDSDLTSIAALTTTPFGRALLELADAAAARTALGTAYGTATGTVAEGISIASATWRTGNYYGAAIPISNAGNAMASGTVRAVPFFNPVAGRTIDQLAIDVFSASGTPAAILYICTDSNGYPGTVVASGSVTPAATSRQTASVSYTLPRGLLWLAAHSTAATWAGLALFGPTPYLPVNPTYSANPMSCWQVTGAGTSTLTAFPAGGTQSANGMQILLRAA